MHTCILLWGNIRLERSLLANVAIVETASKAGDVTKKITPYKCSEIQEARLSPVNRKESQEMSIIM